MIFWKIDDETIRCLINKDEISNMGFDLETISEDADQMEAFLEDIVQSSKEYIEWNPDKGIQNYMARALPADQFLITISCTYQDEIIDRNLDQIRRMTGALNARITEDRLQEIAALSGEDKEKAFTDLSKDLYAVCNGDIPEDETEHEKAKESLPGLNGSGTDVIDVTEHPHGTSGADYKAESPELSKSRRAGKKGQETAADSALPDRKLAFDSLDDIISFAGMLQKNTMFTSSLYKADGQYVLLVRFDKCEKDSDAVAFILTAEEYGGTCSPVHYEDAYMLEHGKELIRDHALEILSTMSLKK